jgi:hypothetical protein
MIFFSPRYLSANLNPVSYSIEVYSMFPLQHSQCPRYD